MICKTNSIVQRGVKFLVYGLPGVGKTRLIATLPNPVIISVEGGLLSLKDMDLDYITVNSLPGLRDAYAWAKTSEEAKQYASVAIDSLSEVAEVILATEKKKARDGRMAYGAMQDSVTEIIRAFRDLPDKHIYMTAKADRIQDDASRMLYAPGMPGTKIAQQLPYFFDEVLALRMSSSTDDEVTRKLLCHSDGVWIAKDRSGALGAEEEPHLAALIACIEGVK